MSFDVSGLIAVRIRKSRSRSFSAYRYYDSSNVMVGKTCTGCAETKLASDFFRKADATDGIMVMCKICSSLRSSDWIASNFESRAKQKRVAYKRDGLKRRHENMDRHRARSDEEICSAQEILRPGGVKVCKSCGVVEPLTSFYKARVNADGLQALCKPCSIADNTNRRLNKHLVYWESKDIPYICYICLGTAQEIEHVIPMTLGGSPGVENTLPACSACNRGTRGKHNTELTEWLETRPDLDTSAVLARVNLYGISIQP